MGKTYVCESYMRTLHIRVVDCPLCYDIVRCDAGEQWVECPVCRTRLWVDRRTTNFNPSEQEGE